MKPLTIAIETRIFSIRGQRVMLDTDLAFLYEVRPIALRQQVQRNKNRFPTDFMFQISREEAKIMVSQNVIPSMKHLGGSLPFVFSQDGVAMLSGVLRSKRAIQVNIQIMRAFVQLRAMLHENRDFAKRLDELEGKYDGQFKIGFQPA